MMMMMLMMMMVMMSSVMQHGLHHKYTYQCTLRWVLDLALRPSRPAVAVLDMSIYGAIHHYIEVEATHPSLILCTNQGILVLS